MKPSAMHVLRYLKRRRGWRGIREVLHSCATNTPTKRLSELFIAGLIDKRRNPDDTRYMQYRYRRAT